MGKKDTNLRGCAKRRDDIDWSMVRDFYVSGYIVENPDTGLPERQFPSYAECGRKFNCAAQTVNYHGKRENWSKLRGLFREGEREYHAKQAGQLAAVSIADIQSHLDALIQQAMGGLEIRSMGELEKAVSLKLKLEALRAKPSRANQSVSLDVLRARHAESRSVPSDKVAGIVTRPRPEIVKTAG